MRRASPVRRARLAGVLPLLAALWAAPSLCAQDSPPAQPSQAAQVPQPAPAAQAESGPIAIVPLASKNPDAAVKVTGALEVSQGKAIIGASGSVTSGSQTTEVVLPHRGVLRVCATTTVKLAADSSVPAGEVPGLLMALDHGAVEASFATGQNSDILLTPDFRILISGPGALEVKVRLGQHGDTCVDNAGAPGDRSSSLGSNAGAPSDRSSPPGWKAGVNEPYVLVSSVFEGGAYRVQPGQRVMFEHGSLREVVDNEKEPCGCPPPPEPQSNEFPLAQSEGLAPLPKPSPSTPNQNSAPTQLVEPLVYKSAEYAAQPAADATPAAGASANPAANPPVAKKKPGFFSKIGRFFKRIFGAE
jgi:hypothetical protein